MSGGFFLGLILYSMGWLFALAGLALNVASWRASLRAKPGERVPSGIPLLPGVMASVMMFLTLPQAQLRLGIEVPWPFLWILLPLLLDPLGLGGMLLAMAGIGPRSAQADGAGFEDAAALAVAPGDVAPDPAAVAAAEAEAAESAAVDAAVGSLLGTAVADALGLPCEGLSRRRQRRWYPDLGRYHLVFGRGMCSDDTDHSCMVAQAVAVSGGDPGRFVSSLAWRLRFWLLGLPAGVGYATLRAILKLWLFFPPQYAGVRSAGNGPAMRSALLGVCFAHDEPALLMHVAANTAITHRDPRAECGALAIALAARASMRRESPQAYLLQLERRVTPFGAAGAELLALVRRAAESASRGEDCETFAASIGCAHAVSGYMYHSVPVALQACFAHADDLPRAVQAVIRTGGDADTTAAMVGGVVGARVGRAGIPAAWLDQLWDWPRGVAWIERAATSACRAARHRVRLDAQYISVPGLLLRNAFFLGVVLAHGFRRLGPPY